MLCPSLVSSAGNVQTSRGRQKQLDHDLSSGALRQIKGRRLMRGDQGNLSSCSKSCFNATRCTHPRTDGDPSVTDHSNETWFSCYTTRKSNTSHSTREAKKGRLNTLNSPHIRRSTMELLVSISKLLSCLRETLTVKRHITERPGRAASGRGSG